MKFFSTITLLSCLLVTFILGDGAMGQRFRPIRQWQQQRNFLQGDPVDDIGRSQRLPSLREVTSPAGRNQRIAPPPQPLSEVSRPSVLLPIQSALPQVQNNTRRYNAPSVNTSRRLRLVPGDIILEINGETIDTQENITRAIALSPPTMYLTVQDGRSGQIVELRTTLNSNRPRFGVSHQTHPNGGSRVLGVNSNSPATRCYLVE